MLQAIYEEASQVANDAIGSIRTIASFCAEKKVMDMYQSKCQAPMKHVVRVALVSGTGFGFSLLHSTAQMPSVFTLELVWWNTGKQHMKMFLR